MGRRIEKLSEERFAALDALVEAALKSGCDCVVISTKDLRDLLDENEDLLGALDADDEGLCECGRQAELCWRCHDGGF